ncbi:hypothetical protein HRI_002747900 [Hibiscus trionum]|uniref:Pectinesterase inhibitor domain-containing protein n=1 Tax=Hibiscus trionum TaxID=183268 RepID=A0A9W7M7X1_HIBTR|nr:hypothetical protein HRI_002747700 [Hibiscus trionum]GMI90786.1 hypothetical protein HRI_002747900 [Hibiscus trionum]
MASWTHFIPVFTILFLSLNIFSPHMVSADQRLIDIVCNDPAIKDHDRCLKTLSTPQGIAANDVNQLVEIAMNEGAMSGQKTLNVIDEMKKKRNDRIVEAALQVCKRTYLYSIDEFKLIAPELNYDTMGANYDVSLINPEIEKCANAVKVARLNVPELEEGNRLADYYATLGYEMTQNMM